MKTLTLGLLILAGCGAPSAATAPAPEPCPEAGPLPSPSDAGLDASDSSALAGAGDAGETEDGRYVVKGDEVFDRTTGLTWYKRFIYGSLAVPDSDVCKGLPNVSPMRRATVAEAVTILVVEPNGEVTFDDPFQWSKTIASQASDGCINLPTFSVGACEGDLINRLCVKQ